MSMRKNASKKEPLKGGPVASKAKRIALISCVSKKQDLVDGEKVPAKDLYISPLFKKAWAYAEKIIQPDAIFILSAEHHILPPETEVGPYNKTLNTMKAAERKEWAKVVKSQMADAGLDMEHDTFFILAGKTYYQYLLGENGIQNAELVYKDCKGIGYILNFLNSKI